MKERSKFFVFNKVTKSIKQVGKLSLWGTGIWGGLDVSGDHQMKALTCVPSLLVHPSHLAVWKPASVCLIRRVQG